MSSPLCRLVTPDSVLVKELANQLNSVDELVSFLINNFNIQPQDSWLSADELLKRWKENKNAPVDCNDVSVIATSILLNMGFPDAKVYIGYQPSSNTNHAVALINNDEGDYIDVVGCSSIEETFNNSIVEFNDQEIIVYDQERYEMILREIENPLFPSIILLLSLFSMLLGLGLFVKATSKI